MIFPENAHFSGPHVSSLHLPEHQMLWLQVHPSIDGGGQRIHLNDWGGNGCRGWRGARKHDRMTQAIKYKVSCSVKQQRETENGTVSLFSKVAAVRGASADVKGTWAVKVVIWCDTRANTKHGGVLIGGEHPNIAQRKYIDWACHCPVPASDTRLGPCVHKTLQRFTLLSKY